MAARYGHLINKWTVAAVGTLALMAALLAIALPASAQSSTVEKLVPYEENGKLPVDTFDATGLDARRVFWYLEGTDASKFKLGSFTGRTTTLHFKSPPNFERPTDEARAAVTEDLTTTPPTIGVAADAAMNNRYLVTVRAGDGGADKSKIFDVTVEVTNAKEPGKIKLTPIQPQVTRQMTAVLSDVDRVNPDALNYSWTSAATMNGSYTPITGALNQNTYTPRPSDVGRFIRVKATYRDGATRNEETAMAEATSDYAVEAQPFPNVAPVFADQDPGNGTTGAVTPADATTGDLATTRTVAEGLSPGALVGPPVTAVDHDGDVLTYSLLAAASPADGDIRHFSIDPKTGQITTKTRLNFEGTAGADSADNCGTLNACSVVVTATDPSGLVTVLPQLSGPTGTTAAASPNVTVTINISAVDESPGGVSLVAAFTIPDFGDSNYPNTFKYQDRPERVGTGGTQGENGGTILANYVATDPDVGNLGGTVTYRVAGPDGSKFIIGADATDATARDGSAGNLRFKNHPNYDKPADENKDNVYELIVVASDRQLNVSTLWVTIKVTDMEENGSVSFNKRRPAVGEPITAELADPDGVVGAVSWQWHNVGTTADTDVTDFTPQSSTAIAGATSATYTPVADDVGEYLKAVATYNDKQAPGEEQRAGATNATIANTSNATTLVVVAIPTTNVDPAFDPDHTSTRRYYVEENEDDVQLLTVSVIPDAGRDTVLAPAVDATDADGDSTATPSTDHTLTYSVEGPDAKYFKIIGSLDDPDGTQGQLRTKVKLDFEDPDRGSYPARVTYNIMVRATDPFGASAEVPVTVIVIDVAEDPEIADPPSGSPVSVMVHDEEVKAPMAVVFDENGTGTVADFSAKDPDGDSIAWSVVATTHPDSAETDFDTTLLDATSVDSDLFEINSLTGVLTFKSPPNYEDKKDTVDTATGSSTATDNIYQVTIRARSLDTVGGSSDDERDDNDTYRLKVKVLNVPENPVFRISSSARSREEDHGDEGAVTRGPNRPIGDAPVTATDPDNTDADADTLTYTLEGTDAASFSIVPATGQLLTKDALDYETKSSYSVVVKASDATEMDPAKRDDTIDIGIEVLDVLEIRPVGLSVEGQPDVSYTENDTAAVAEYTAVGDTADNVTWNPIKGDDAAYFMLEGPEPGSSSVMLKFRESPNFEMPRGMAMSGSNTNTYNITIEILHTTTNTTASLPVVVTVQDATELGTLTGMGSVSYMENDTVAVGTYMVDGPMAADAMWSLEGDDMDLFMLDTDTGGSVMLMFSEPPNFEMPMGGAAGDSNTYMVTVMAAVGGEMTMQDVTVMVTDTDDPGMVTITPMPEVLTPGMELTAALSDDDGRVQDVTWQWSKSMDMSSWMDISGATSMSYTPVDADHGYYLRATATYTDAYGSPKTAMDTTASKVDANQAPMFAAETATRMVAENSAAGTNVGAPVTATDADNDTLVYTLGGTDAGYFSIGSSTGQIMVGAGAMLDYETRTEYMVTVTATDPDGASDTIMVTIMVTDVDEPGPDPLIARYDANGNGMIDKAEVIAAINDYLFDGTLTKAEVIRLINLYLFG